MNTMAWMGGMSLWVLLLEAVVVAVLGIVIGYLAHKAATARTIGDAETRASRIVDDARRTVEQTGAQVEAKLREAEDKIRTAELEAKEMALRVRAELETETRARHKSIEEVERRVLQQEEQLARKLDQLERRDGDLSSRDRSLQQKERELQGKETQLGAALDEQRRKLEVIAGLTAEEARRQLVAQMEEEARREAQLIGMRLEEEARETAQVKAKEVLATTIQRLAPDYTVETAVSIVDLPSDDMKGRIIGREGRNIRALEAATGIDLIIDDTPEAVLISAFDPVPPRDRAAGAHSASSPTAASTPPASRRWWRRSRRSMEQHCKEAGEQACFELGLHGLHPELVQLVGRLKFRTSYAQNLPAALHRGRRPGRA